MENGMSEKTKHRIRIAAAAVVAGGTIAALILTRRPLSESIRDNKPPSTVPSPCEPEPVRGDNVCQVNKGEADPLSPNFDPQSCGYCGDGIRQIRINGPHGSEVRIDENGIRTQDVTERLTEIPSSDPRAREPEAATRYIICDVDFHCGNGRRDQGERYSGWIAPLSEGAPYTFGIIPITETADSCRLDSNHTSRHERLPREETVEIIDQRPGSFFCSSQIASTDTTEIIGSQSASANTVRRRINEALIMHASDLRTALGVEASARLEVTLSILVAPTGAVSLQNISARTRGGAVGDQTTIINTTGLSISGLSIVAPGAQCQWIMTVTVPSL
ncbi:MAG TPA: hypothetical protein VLD37_06310 [Candidatus Bilamarchaeum sp.]|nr:hypothetical protein [Candidatus Bilamarchaeum sp.]